MYHSVATAPNAATRDAVRHARRRSPSRWSSRRAGASPRSPPPIWPPVWRTPAGRCPERPGPDHLRRRLRGRAPARAARARQARLRVHACSSPPAGSAARTTPGAASDTMLDWDQVRELAAADVEIGGHSHTHPQLDQLDDDALRLRADPLQGDRHRRTRHRARPRSPTRTATPAAGCAGGARDGVRPGARRRQRPGAPPPGPVRAAARDRAPQHRASRSSSGSSRAVRSPATSPGTVPSPRGTPWSAEHDRSAGRPSRSRV